MTKYLLRLLSGLVMTYNTCIFFMIFFPDARARCSGAWFERMLRSAKHDVKKCIIYC